MHEPMNAKQSQLSCLCVSFLYFISQYS